MECCGEEGGAERVGEERARVERAAVNLSSRKAPTSPSSREHMA